MPDPGTQYLLRHFGFYPQSGPREKITNFKAVLCVRIGFSANVNPDPDLEITKNKNSWVRL
jgi:hypothetical protein